jgi:hypothetical protein
MILATATFEHSFWGSPPGENIEGHRQVLCGDIQLIHSPVVDFLPWEYSKQGLDLIGRQEILQPLQLIGLTDGSQNLVVGAQGLGVVHHSFRLQKLGCESIYEGSLPVEVCLQEQPHLRQAPAFFMILPVSLAIQ